MHPKRNLLTLAALTLALAAACGNTKDDNANASDTKRTVNVEMVDVAFKPADVTVAKGESIRFVFKNTGTTDHEAYLGTPMEQTDHDKKMTDKSKGSGHDMGSMGGGGDTAVTVGPGKTGELTTRFNKAGTFEIGCHQPGHYTAGMKITVTVS